LGATLRVPKIDALGKCDYSDHMTVTLREAKAKLSEMVKRASQGEEILITVHGKVRARLTQPMPKRSLADNRKWARELAALRRKYSTGKRSRTAEEIISEGREERL
jgi:prevent-host-death family protein